MHSLIIRHYLKWPKCEKPSSAIVAIGLVLKVPGQAQCNKEVIMAQNNTSKRGTASMSKAKRQEIASQGGQASGGNNIKDTSSSGNLGAM